jgi:hypothetical protein
MIELFRYLRVGRRSGVRHGVLVRGRLQLDRLDMELTGVLGLDPLLK